jgi:hypothetical protein
VRRLEWWPDYDGGLLREAAKPVDLGRLGLPDGLLGQIANWMAQYGDERLPIDGPGDQAWLEEGGILLKRVRLVLGELVEVYVTEPWWGVADEDFEQPGTDGQRDF